MRFGTLLLAFFCIASSLGGCADMRDSAVAEAYAATGGGDAKAGKVLIRQFGCGACHTIPGIEGARGIVGPPLTNIASRSYVGGVLTNTPENMMKWIQNPRAVNPMTAMPDLGLTPAQARDVAAYLYTLR